MKPNLAGSADELKLECYQVSQYTTEMVPGRGRRGWMDETRDRFAYRCLPLSMANSTGWELRCPAEVKIVWDGKQGEKAIKVYGYDPHVPVNMFAQSHFGEGVVTFIPGYLFRTPPGVALWVTGPPNQPKDGIYPLTGLVETDWLPFPFTMNWKMTRPGEVVFEKDEPFAFLTLIEHNKLEDVTPEMKSIHDNPELRDEFNAWTRSRHEFNQSLKGDESLQQAWQNFYIKGQSPSKAQADEKSHRTKRRLQTPKPRK